MRDFAKIRPVFWTKGTGKKLRGDADAQVVALYLMSAPLSHMSGVYYLPFWTICNETGVSRDGVAKALRWLQKEGFAYHDDEADLVFVTNMAREQIGPSMKTADKRVKGLLNHLSDFKNHSFYGDFARAYARAFGLNLKALGVKPQAPPKQREGEGEGEGEKTPAYS